VDQPASDARLGSASSGPGFVASGPPRIRLVSSRNLGARARIRQARCGATGGAALSVPAIPADPVDATLTIAMTEFGRGEDRWISSTAAG